MATNDLIANMYEEPEVTGLARQRQLAQLLIQGGAQTPQGQMINGMYVPVNPMERIGNLGSLLMGLKSSENLDAKQSELAAALRQKEMGALENYLRLKRGTPGQEGTPDFVQAGPMPDGSNIPIQYGKKAIAAVPGDAEAANLYAASNPYSKVLREMGIKGLSRDPKWEPTTRTVNGMKETGWVNVNSDNPEATFRLGSRSPDLDVAKAIDEGYYPTAGTPSFGGMPQQGGQMPQGRIGGFENAVTNLWPREGGYVAKDGSSGAPANFGINQKWHPEIDVSKLTKDQAKQIYKTKYWDYIGADNLSPAAQEIAFDAAVNQGPEFAKQIIAQTGADPMKMLQLRAERYQQTAQRSPEDAKNYPVWMKRLNEVGQLALSTQPAQSGQSSIPQYQYNSALSPKKNREEAAKFDEEVQKNVKNAKNSFPVIKEAASILQSGKPTSGKLNAAYTAGKEWLGIESDASEADNQLRVLGGALTGMQPRFEGPQGVLDVELYKQMAGDIANRDLPISSRMASLRTMINLQKKYDPSNDWESILKQITPEQKSKKVSLGAPQSTNVVDFSQLKK